MKVSLFLSCLLALGLTSAFGQNFGVVPNDGTGNSYPAVSANGQLIAYFPDMSSGGSKVMVYNTSTGVSACCSTGIPYCSRPRVSRDGTYVTYFGTAFYGDSNPNDWMIVCPVVYTISAGSWVSAIRLVNTNIPEPNSTMLWSTTNPQYAIQAPGVTNYLNNPSGPYWTVSFGDLTARTPPPEGACRRIRVHLVCASIRSLPSVFHA